MNRMYKSGRYKLEVVLLVGYLSSARGVIAAEQNGWLDKPPSPAKRQIL